VIERDSGVKFSSEDRAALLHKPLADKYDPRPLLDPPAPSR